MTSTARRMQLLAPAIGLIVGLSSFARPALAGQLVTFSRGQSLVVQSAEKRGEWYYLTLDGGGQIGVPAARVLRVEEYEAPPPPPAPVLPPPTYPVPTAAQAAPQAGAQQVGAGIPNPVSAPPGSVTAGAPDPLAAERRSGEESPQDWRSPMDRRDGPRQRAMGGGGFSVMKPGAGGGRPQLGQGGFRRPPGAGVHRPPQDPNNPPQQ